MFELTDGTRTSERLSKLGFVDIRVSDFDVIWSAPSPAGVSRIVEQGLVREDFAERIVAAAFRHAEPDPERVVVVLRSGGAAEV